MEQPPHEKNQETLACDRRINLQGTIPGVCACRGDSDWLLRCQNMERVLRGARREFCAMYQKGCLYGQHLGAHLHPCRYTHSPLARMRKRGTISYRKPSFRSGLLRQREMCEVGVVWGGEGRSASTIQRSNKRRKGGFYLRDVWK